MENNTNNTTNNNNKTCGWIVDELCRPLGSVPLVLVPGHAAAVDVVTVGDATDQLPAPHFLSKCQQLRQHMSGLPTLQSRPGPTLQADLGSPGQSCSHTHLGWYTPPRIQIRKCSKCRTGYFHPSPRHGADLGGQGQLVLCPPPHQAAPQITGSKYS